MGSEVWKESELRRVVAESTTVAQCLRKLGLVTRGKNFQTLRNKASKWRIDTSHFEKNASLRTLKEWREKGSLSDEEVFSVDSKAGGKAVRSRYVKLKGIGPCSSCGVGCEYNGKYLTLQLDHKNGVHSDNRLDNLRWLCPNCHSQTDTYGTKLRIPKVKSNDRGRATKGREYPEEWKVDHAVVFSKYKEIGTYLGTAKFFGNLSDNGVKKIVKKYISGDVA